MSIDIVKKNHPLSLFHVFSSESSFLVQSIKLPTQSYPLSFFLEPQRITRNTQIREKFCRLVIYGFGANSCENFYSKVEPPEAALLVTLGLPRNVRWISMEGWNERFIYLSRENAVRFWFKHLRFFLIWYSRYQERICLLQWNIVIDMGIKNM